MERVLEELEMLARHWDDSHGVASLSDVSGHDGRQDDRQSSPAQDSSR